MDFIAAFCMSRKMASGKKPGKKPDVRLRLAEPLGGGIEPVGIPEHLQQLLHRLGAGAPPRPLGRWHTSLGSEF